MFANVNYFYNSLSGCLDQAPPPYPGPHVSGNKQQNMAPYSPTVGAAAPILQRHHHTLQHRVRVFHILCQWMHQLLQHHKHH